MLQKTIGKEIKIRGQGLHSGIELDMLCCPAEENTGIVFYRDDLPETPGIPARVENVIDTTRCTAIGRDGMRIQTIEHLMAALAGLRIDNLRVYVNGPEIPLGDGSAYFFTQKFLEAGLIEQKSSRQVMELKEAVWVSRPLSSGKMAVLAALPSDRTGYSYTFVSEHEALADQYAEFDPERDDFQSTLAAARTVAFLKEIEYLRKHGLALGGNEDIAVVVGEKSLINEMRMPQEVAKHKIIDMMGDLYLLGPVKAHFIGIRSGHSLDYILAKKLAEILMKK